jgi:hypothetical protein
VSDSSDLEAHFRIRVDGKDELEELYSSGEAGAKRFSENTARYLQKAGAGLSALSAKGKAELGAFAGQELGGSLGGEARGVLKLRDAINQLAVSSGGGNAMMDGLNKQIQAVAVSSNQMQGDVTAALQAFVEKTGDIRTARDNIAEYGRVATATGSALSDVAQVGVELKEKLNISEQTKSFAILATLSKAGSIELRDFARQAPRIFNVAASAGVTGEAGLRQIGALSEVYGSYVGGSGANKAARVATSIENTFASIAKKLPQLEAAGVKVQGRDRFDVLFDIIRKTGGDETKLREVFSQQAMRAVLGLANEFKATGGFGKYEELRRMDVNTSLIGNDFATRTSTGEAKLKANQIGRQRFYEQYLGGIAEYGAAHATELQIGSYGLSYAGKGLSLLGRAGGALGGRVGQAVGAATAARVFVTNFSELRGALGAGGGPGGAPASRLGKAAAVFGVGVAAYELTTLADEASGGRISGGVANAMGYLSGQKGKLAGIEGAGADLNKIQLARQKAQRDALVQDYEMKGLTHGAALNAADQQIKAEIKNLTVVINDNEAHAEDDSGTRSPKVLVRRGGGGEE